MVLAELIDRFGPQLLRAHGERLSSEARFAIKAMRQCQRAAGPHWLADCSGCEACIAGPHSCGNRACPHCQHGISDAWRQRHIERLLPVDHFLVTFTLPAALRPVARCHPRTVYDALMRCAWQTLRDFARNDRRLGAQIGATAVLHTHSRSRDYHPHVHLLVPAGGVDSRTGHWRSKSRYLFRSGSLAKVFRAKLLQALREAGLKLPTDLPATWVADCSRVGNGAKAVGYLARYLYRGVLSERDLIGCDGKQVQFRYRDGQTGTCRTRTLDGVDFLHLLLQHVLPKGFHRARDFGLLHPKRKALLARLQYLLQVRLPESSVRSRPLLRCPECGAPMRVIATRLTPVQAHHRLRLREQARSSTM